MNKETGINLPDISMYDEICNLFNISLVEFINGEDIIEEDKLQKLEEELNKSLKKQSKLNKFFELGALLLIGLGFIFLFITSLVNYPITVDNAESWIIFFISFIGFVILMFESKKTVLRKLVYISIFIVVFVIFYNLIILFNLRFNVNSGNVNKYENYNYVYVLKVYDVKKDFNEDDLDNFIENNNSIENFYEVSINKISYRIPFIHKYINFYYDKDFKFLNVKLGIDSDLDNDPDTLDDIYKILNVIDKKRIYTISFNQNDMEVYMDIYETKNNYVFKYNHQNLVVNKNDINRDKIVEYGINIINSNKEYFIFDLRNSKKYMLKK